uniref:O-acyltransferase n=1 Tax=Phallusia mammillata TaxID=59560 RepID=A0A6F9DBG6_9ASCI|nr:diacylglycerol O-acyltransferase 1 [Phallusia mammillata]
MLWTDETLKMKEDEHSTQKSQDEILSDFSSPIFEFNDSTFLSDEDLIMSAINGNGLRKRKNRSFSISDDNLAKQEPSKNGKVEKTREIPEYGMKKCHSARASLFSSSSGFDDYRGFLNLCVVLLAVTNARVFLENIMKYGILVDPVQWVATVLDNPYKWPNLLLILGSNVFILCAFHIEKMLLKEFISATTCMYLHILNLLLLILLPPFRILQQPADPVGSLSSCGVYVILFLKLWSFAQANKWYREDYLKSQGKRKLQRTMSMPSSALKSLRDGTETIEVKYPYNLRYRNMYYFILAPTLCYETQYPRNKSINKVYLARRLVETVFLVQLGLALVQQWIVPVLQKAIMPIHNKEGYYVVERLLKLAIPNHFIWLIFFYCMFHSILNVIAEVLRFADREFYRDWWNSETIDYFWKAWNIPVHKWCLRHVYKPLLSVGYKKFTAQLCVFLLSAFFHEYLVSIPLHLFRTWAFMGMAMQIPLSVFTILITKRFSGHYGNMIVWMSLILGQPIAILAYVYHYYIIQYAPNAQ